MAFTDWDLAMDQIDDAGCDCGTDEPGTCLGCVCKRALRAERDAKERATRRAERAEAIFAHLTRWTHEFGAQLIPPGADSYGEGVRDSKTAVSRILGEHHA